MGIITLLKKIFNTEKTLNFKYKIKEDWIEIIIYNKEKKILLSKVIEEYLDVELEFFLEAQVFQIIENTIVLRYIDIPKLSNDELEYFGLPIFFDGTIEIKNKGYILNKQGLEFEFKFFDKTGTYRSLEGKNFIFHNSTGEIKFLNSIHNKLKEELEIFNSDNSINSRIENQFKIINLIQKSKEDIKILFLDQLKDFSEVEINEKLVIDFLKSKKDNNLLEVLPKLSELSEIENKLLQDKFRNSPRVNQYYEIEVDGKIKKIVFSSKIRNALQLLKEEPEISELDFISKNSKLFSDERLEEEEIEINYGPRVEGLGYLIYRSSPPRTDSGIDWLSSPSVQTLTEKVYLTPDDIEPLQKAINITQDKEPVVAIINKQRIVFPTKEVAQKEIENIKSRIIDYKQLEDKQLITEVYEYFLENTEQKYMPKKGAFVKKPKKIEELLEFLEELPDKGENYGQENELVLLLKDNLDELDYEEKIENNFGNYKYIQPLSLNSEIKLHQHQEEGVAKLQHLYEVNEVNGVLLADDMGLGKTIQILTFLAWLKEEKIKEKPLKVLLVMPTSLITNWDYESDLSAEKGEIQKFFIKDTFKTKSFKGRLCDEKIKK